MKFDRFLAAAASAPPAVVLQVSYACGLGIVRDLAPHGVPVLGLDTDPRSVGLSSRLAAAAVCPDPRADEEAFLAFLEDLGRRLPQRAVLFPSHDQFIWPLSRHAERLKPWFIVPFSRWPEMERVYDKRGQLEAAWRAGVDTPRTVFVDGPGDIAQAVSEVPFPAIVKPVESLAFKDRFRRHVLDVATAGDLETLYPQVNDCGTLIVQERVPGGDDELYTLGSYLDAQSRPLAVFTGHKIRQHPAGAGSCRLGVSRWVPEMANAGLALLAEIRFHGVSQVEFKRDPRDGRYRLMEINARHWMWHSLAARCGVNLSLAAYRDVIGRPFMSPRQVDGLKWIVATKDVPLSLLEIARRRQTLTGFARSLRGVRVDGVLSLRDPLPGMRWAGRVARLSLHGVNKTRFEW
jgi:D-aspartate ligase